MFVAVPRIKVLTTTYVYLLARLAGPPCRLWYAYNKRMHVQGPGIAGHPSSRGARHKRA